MTGHLKVVEAYPTNFRDIGTMLRRLADDIEAGVYGAVGSVVAVALGDKLHIFGMGPGSDHSQDGMMLHAAALKMTMPLVEHGGDG